MSVNHRLALLLLLLAGVVAMGIGFSDARLTTENIDGRAEFVEKLLKVSSAARQVLESDSEEAIALREEAVGRYDAALIARDGDDLETAERLLQEATQLMFQAVSKAGRSADVIQKKRKDFETRRDSVRALADAHGRILGPDSEEHVALQQRVDTAIQDAEKRAEQAEYDAARDSLDSVFAEVKQAIELSRTGQTLVRSLEFDSPEDEYLYELDRNDTHQMLITLLVAEKMQRPGVEKMVRDLTEKAKTLREEAELTAQAGDFTKAIGQMESSTAELVKAIRRAGIYIPG